MQELTPQSTPAKPICGQGHPSPSEPHLPQGCHPCAKLGSWEGDKQPSVVAPATRWCCFMQQGASWCSETSLAIKSCCCLTCLQHSQMLLSLSPGWFWGLGCPSDLHPNTPLCRSDGHPFSTLQKRCRHVGLKMQDLNPTAARLGTLQELRGADLSTRAVTSRETGNKNHTLPSCTPWVPGRLRQLSCTDAHRADSA